MSTSTPLRCVDLRAELIFDPARTDLLPLVVVGINGGTKLRVYGVATIVDDQEHPVEFQLITDPDYP